MITVNGKEVEWRQGMTVENLLAERNFKFPLIIVRINGQLVKKENYASTKIPDGAEVSAMHLISGG